MSSSSCFFFFFQHVYLCALYVLGADRGQKRALDSPELELQIIASYHVGAGSQTPVLSLSL